MHLLLDLCYSYGEGLRESPPLRFSCSSVPLGSVHRWLSVRPNVAATREFTRRPKVAHAASELLRGVFGEEAHHVRATKQMEAPVSDVSAMINDTFAAKGK